MPVFRLLLTLVALSIIGYVQHVHAQSVLPMQNIYGRSASSLDGTWQYIVDPMETGLIKSKYRRDFPADDKAKLDEGVLIEYDWDTSPEIQVPGDWNSQIAGMEWYEGLVWYRKRFNYEITSERQFLYFEAVNYKAQVYLNGEKLGIHEGGFTPFQFEVTGKLKPTGNSLVLAVDNKRREDGIPAADFDWWNYGGITRSVWLVETESVFITDYHLALNPDGNHLEGYVTLDGSASEEEIMVQIPELGVKKKVYIGSSGTADFQVKTPKELERWFPDTPKRYTVTYTRGDDMIADRVGFKTASTQGYEILLNGEPQFLRGICIHEEAMGTPTRRLDWDMAERLLREAKEMNANFVRLAHYPHTEKMTRLADSLGLMVWTEIPVYWEDIDYQNPKTLALATRMIRSNYERDKNRASILLWSVANETPIHRDRMSFLKHLIKELKNQNEHLLVTAALKVSHEGGVKRIDDPLGAYLDVVSVNTYVGWYGTDYPDAIPDVAWESDFTKPLVFSEFGAGAVYGNRGDKMTRWTEDFQAYFIDQTMTMALDIPFLRGTMPWVLKDFRTPRRYHGQFQQYWNRKGLIDPQGNRKQAFVTLSNWYSCIQQQENINNE
ncbi:MAG: glycoside hydrolase family 2 TIM barrel-domain containing protein [Bacteroidota bacterium]